MFEIFKFVPIVQKYSITLNVGNILYITLKHAFCIFMTIFSQFIREFFFLKISNIYSIILIYCYLYFIDQLFIPFTDVNDT